MSLFSRKLQVNTVDGGVAVFVKREDLFEPIKDMLKDLLRDDTEEFLYSSDVINEINRRLSSSIIATWVGDPEEDDYEFEEVS